MNVLKRILKGVILKPESTTPSDASNGALWYDSTLGKLRGYISGSARSVVNEDQSQTLTNKTIDADLNTINNIENGDIKAAAAIEMTKLAAMASDKAVFTDVSGFLNTATTTATELDYLSGVTSGVQSQLNGKVNSSDLTTHISDTTTHGTTGDIVGTSDTQNLSNKTFTNVTNFTDTTDSTTKDTGALVIEGGVGIEKSVTIGINLEVLGNLTVQGTTTTINTATLDVEDANITINSGGNDAGAEGAGLTVDRTGTSGSFVYEDALASKFKIGAAGSEAQVVTVSHTQTLTNKTLTSPSLTTPSLDVMTLDGQASTPASPSAGFYKAYVKDSTNKLTLLDSSGNETSIGAGGGSVNFVTNPDAEAGTTGWTIDSFAAATRPAGAFTGTTTGITFSTSSSSPLAGVNSFTLAKDASNCQGRVVYTPITIQPAYQAKVLNVSMDYIVSSGTFVAGSSGVDSDVIVYLQDVTNSTFIEPSSFKFLSNSSTIADRFNATFQTSATGTSYRLILYCATTSASAYTVKFDNISVSPSTYVYGTPIRNWQSYTPTWTNLTVGNATQTFKWRQVGDSMEISGHISWGSTTSSTASLWKFSLPSGYSIDNSKARSSVGYARVGTAWSYDSGVSAREIFRIIQDSTSNNFYVEGRTDAGVSSTFSNTQPFTWTTNDEADFLLTVPILGWSSSVQTSDQTDTRVLQAKFGGSSTSITGSATLVQFDSAQYDSHGLLTTGASSRFTASMPGFYNVDAFIQFNSAAIGSGGIQTLSLYKNGSSFDILDRQNWSSATLQVALSGSTKVYLIAGDYIDLRATNNTTTSLDGNAYMTIERATGPSAIAATESINARYTTTSGSIANASNTEIINFGTKDFDSHGSVTTGASWKFTAPISGKYRISANLTTTSTGNFSAGEYIETRVYKTGSIYAAKIHSDYNGSTSNKSVQIVTTINLLAGEDFDIRMYQTSGGAMPLESAAGYNWVDIERIGN